MTKLSEKYRIKNKTLSEVSAALFDLNKFPKSFAKTFEISGVETTTKLEVGAKASLTLKKFGVSAYSEYVVTELSIEKLTYKQTCGLMKKWIHTMTLREANNGVIEVVDDISYEVPCGLLGHLANDLFLRSEVPNMLYHRLKSLKLK